MFLGFAEMSCSRPGHEAAQLPEPIQSAADVPAPDGKATAVFAAGCFWCVEAVFEQLEGVKSVESGYAGGKEDTAKYEIVSSGGSGHAEVVQITYDPTKITYSKLLKVFFATHDPTQKDRQGPDWGSQYRSAVFYSSDAQKDAAAAYIKQLDESAVFDKPIATTLEELNVFYPAEAYHQDFVQRNPNHPYIVRYALPKVDKVRDKFGESVKSE